MTAKTLGLLDAMERLASSENTDSNERNDATNQ